MNQTSDPSTTVGQPDMFKPVQDWIASKQPTLWMFEGDSITHGARHTKGSRDYAELFEERVRYEMSRRQDLVINCAFSGNRTVQVLERFERNLKRFKPDVVFLMIGMNDCSSESGISLTQFSDNLNKLASLAQLQGAALILQTTCPLLPDTNAQRNPQFENYMQAIRDTAVRLNLPLVDHAAHWHASGIDKRIAWLANAFHPNAQGHAVFAKLLMTTLGIYDPSTPQGLVIEQVLDSHAITMTTP